MKAVIDRFEGNYAVVLCGEQETPLAVPKMLLPEDAAEGDCLKLSFEPDPSETEKRREKARHLLNRLKGR